MYVEGWNVHRVVRPSRLANAVIERLLLRILDGEFQPGGDLPPEAALAQEFAERLYARIVRGTEAGRGIESPAVQNSAPVVDELTRREMAGAEPNSSATTGLPVPNQSPLRTQPVRRRPGVELRPTMVGAGSSGRSLL